MSQPAKKLPHDPVLAALAAAPFVDLTEQEELLLDEADNHPGPTIPHEDFARLVATLRPTDE